MRKLLLLFLTCLSIVVWPYSASAQDQEGPPAFDWSWCFTKVTDGSGNVLAQKSGLTEPTTEPLLFSVSPTIGALKLYGTMFVGQELNVENISFWGTGISHVTSFPNPPYWSDIFVDWDMLSGWDLMDYLEGIVQPHLQEAGSGGPIEVGPFGPFMFYEPIQGSDPMPPGNLYGWEI